MTAELVAVNVVYAIMPGHRRDSAIDKRPVSGAVDLGRLGLSGDTQCDARYHGGPDKAVYAYAAEDNRWWSAELGRPIPAGTFGENLSTAGLDINSALIGEIWQLGSRVLVEVRSPRTPCANLSHRMGMPRFHRRFDRTGRVGAYLRVLDGGPIAAGDPITVVSRPAHDVTIRDWNQPTAGSAGALLNAGIDLADVVRRQAERLVDRGDGE